MKKNSKFENTYAGIGLSHCLYFVHLVVIVKGVSHVSVDRLRSSVFIIATPTILLTIKRGFVSQISVNAIRDRDKDIKAK